MATERLTYRQRMFVSAYLGEAQGNATEAARIAGYAKPAEQGYENLRKPHIAVAIDAKLNQASISADEILARISDHATASVEDFLRFDAKGRPTLDLNKARKRGRLHCIKKLKQREDGLEVELYDAQAALDKLARFRQLYTDKLDLTGLTFRVEYVNDWRGPDNPAAESPPGAEGRPGGSEAVHLAGGGPAMAEDDAGDVGGDRGGDSA